MDEDNSAAGPMMGPRRTRMQQVSRALPIAWQRGTVVCAVSLFVFGLIDGPPVRAEGLFPLGARTEASRLSDQPIPFKSSDQIPPRLPLLVELGDPFLSTGNLGPGFEIPTGAVWQPRLWVFATHRSAVQTFDNGVGEPTTEWANRLDLFANLQLTGTEKLVLGIRPLDKNRFGQFSGYVAEDVPGVTGRKWESELNANVRTLFFEGDFGSLFPNLDRAGIKPIDYGFAVGRQPLVFQRGILINDTVDALGIVRNNLHPKGFSNVRVSGVWGWGELDRNDSRKDPQANMFGIFTAADLPSTTIEIDAIRVEDRDPNGDGWYFGASSTQHFGGVGATFRVNASFADDTETPQVAEGVLLSAEIAWTPKSSDDIVYINPFLAEERFTQAGRDPVNGGPLAALGILFASNNIGNHRSELSAAANDVLGIAIGYQAFWDQFRRNLVLEVAGRKDTSGNGLDDAAVGFQLQQKIKQRFLVQVDGFYAVQEGRDDAHGARLELLIQF